MPYHIIPRSVSGRTEGDSEKQNTGIQWVFLAFAILVSNIYVLSGAVVLCFFRLLMSENISSN